MNINTALTELLSDPSTYTKLSHTSKLNQYQVSMTTTTGVATLSYYDDSPLDPGQIEEDILSSFVDDLSALIVSKSISDKDILSHLLNSSGLLESKMSLFLASEYLSHLILPTVKDCTSICFSVEPLEYGSNAEYTLSFNYANLDIADV